VWCEECSVVSCGEWGVLWRVWYVCCEGGMLWIVWCIMESGVTWRVWWDVDRMMCSVLKLKENKRLQSIVLYTNHTHVSPTPAHPCPCPHPQWPPAAAPLSYQQWPPQCCPRQRQTHLPVSGAFSEQLHFSIVPQRQLWLGPISSWW